MLIIHTRKYVRAHTHTHTHTYTHKTSTQNIDWTLSFVSDLCNIFTLLTCSVNKTLTVSQTNRFFLLTCSVNKTLTVSQTNRFFLLTCSVNKTLTVSQTNRFFLLTCSVNKTLTVSQTNRFFLLTCSVNKTLTVSQTNRFFLTRFSSCISFRTLCVSWNYFCFRHSRHIGRRHNLSSFRCSANVGASLCTGLSLVACRIWTCHLQKKDVIQFYATVSYSWCAIKVSLWGSECIRKSGSMSEVKHLHPCQIHSNKSGIQCVPSGCKNLGKSINVHGLIYSQIHGMVVIN